MSTLSQPAVTRAGTAPKRATWAPLAVILCGTFVYILDFFIVNVALPDIQRSLGASPAAIEWAVAGYGLTSASFLVVGGRLGDHFGRRRLFCAGLALFTITSALCAAAPHPGFLVAARLAQGTGAALMAPNILSILGTTYTGKDGVRAISVYGMVMGVAAVGGQLLDGRQQGWPAWSWACLAAGPVLLGAFAAHLRRVRARGGQPLLDPGIFAVRAFRAGLPAHLVPRARSHRPLRPPGGRHWRPRRRPR